MSRCSALVQIEDKIVDARVLTEFFSCDLSQCKGACCVEGSSGAPLEMEEIASLDAELNALLRELPARNQEALARGVAYRDADREWVTRLVDGGECAFSCSEGGITLCAIERAKRAGRVGQDKPISCALYPIRVERAGALLRLNYHVWEICAPARRKGKADGVRVYEFLRGPIERRFGKGFYEQLDTAARYLARPGGAVRE